MLILEIVSYMQKAVTVHGIFPRVLQQVPKKNSHDHYVNCSVYKKLSLMKRIYTYFLLWMNYCIIRYVAQHWATAISIFRYVTYNQLLTSSHLINKLYSEVFSLICKLVQQLRVLCVSIS